MRKDNTCRTLSPVYSQALVGPTSTVNMMEQLWFYVVKSSCRNEASKC